MAVSKRNEVQSARRALEILEHLAEAGQSSLKAICIAGRLERPTAYRLLRTLRDLRYVEADGRGSYRLGPRSVRLGLAMYRSITLVAVARDVLDRLVQVTNETVNLAVMDGVEVLYVDKRESLQPLTVTAKVGERRPAHCTALGKAMLAFLARESLNHYAESCNFSPVTPRSITGREALEDELAKVRAAGVAFDHEEVILGVCCVAAPVFDEKNGVIGAVSVAGPCVRFTPDREQSLAHLVAEAAAEISARLGHRGGAWPSVGWTGSGDMNETRRTSGPG